MKLDRPTRRLHLDPHDPAFVQDPHAAYRRLHAECPSVFWVELDRWCFFGHREVDSMLRSRRLGRSLEGVPGVAARPPLLDVDRHSLLELEPPTHTRLRRLVQGAFVARSIEALRPRIEALCHQLIDELEANGSSADLLPAWATPIPVVVIAELLGVPREQCDRLLAWSHAMVAVYEVSPSEGQIAAGRAAGDEFGAFLRDLLARRRQDPRDDLLTHLARAEAEGDRLSEEELISTCILLLNAGHEATVHALGNAVLRLLEQADALATWRREPQRTAAVVEELLRFDAPVHLFNRWVLEDQVVDDGAGDPVELPRGAQVALVLGAANRDPRVFAQPDRIELERPKNQHLAFGAGLHHCLGAPLARLEMQVALPILWRRLPGLRLDGETRFRDSYPFRGLETLPVSF
ncbi:MAG: cytochrome P450 [Acidobacteria bacterium]|nr:MAG: cytochrome P450 [Acidobacteriota bacterium]REK05847.1 MAG: cytochrome P450 [Acidobacteriota bacterium]